VCQPNNKISTGRDRCMMMHSVTKVEEPQMDTSTQPPHVDPKERRRGDLLIRSRLRIVRLHCRSAVLVASLRSGPDHRDCASVDRWTAHPMASRCLTCSMLSA
jgi:hypothetical protein